LDLYWCSTWSSILETRTSSGVLNIFKKNYMHLMILWTSAQTSKEIRKYLTIVNIFVSKLRYSIISKHFLFWIVGQPNLITIETDHNAYTDATKMERKQQMAVACNGWCLDNSIDKKFRQSLYRIITILNYFKTFPILNCLSTNSANVILIYRSIR
jgi:hypothetical protein